MTYEHLTPQYKSFISSIFTQIKPNSYNESCESPEWKKAIDAKIAALEVNNTWILSDLPLGKQVVGCKWVYKIKYSANGSVERYKTRLIAKGYTQQEGLDYHETFSSMVKMVLVRMLLALAALNG